MIQPFDFIYLASQSPRRAQLLDQLGVPHRPLLPGSDEDAEALEVERAGESPRDYVCRVTRAKAQAAARRLDERAASQGLAPAPVLCADTTVALDGRILGKPQDDTRAVEMLQALSGRSHQVLTAVAIGADLRLSESLVTWRRLSSEEIQRYAASREPMGKAGAYAIQSRAAAWTERIEGSYSGIMGLPLFETAELLRALGRQV